VRRIPLLSSIAVLIVSAVLFVVYFRVQAAYLTNRNFRLLAVPSAAMRDSLFGLAGEDKQTAVEATQLRTTSRYRPPWRAEAQRLENPLSYHALLDEVPLASSFDALLVADATGRVLAQRAQADPALELRRLDALPLSAGPQPIPLASLNGSSSMSVVRLRDQDYRLFCQPAGALVRSPRTTATVRRGASAPCPAATSRRGPRASRVGARTRTTPGRAAGARARRRGA
jgi:hypothetical protein